MPMSKILFATDINGKSIVELPGVPSVVLEASHAAYLRRDADADATSPVWHQTSAQDQRSPPALLA